MGPYENLHTVYETLVGKWITQHNHELRSEPPFEIYLNDPKVTQPKDLITEIYVPIE